MGESRFAYSSTVSLGTVQVQPIMGDEARPPYPRQIIIIPYVLYERPTFCKYTHKKIIKEIVTKVLTITKNVIIIEANDIIAILTVCQSIIKNKPDTTP